MSEDDPNNQLAQVEHGALALTSLADSRILSEMVGASLVLARDSAVAHVDLDPLVREGKRLYCSIVKGRGLRAGELREEDIQAFNFRLDSGLSQRDTLHERMKRQPHRLNAGGQGGAAAVGRSETAGATGRSATGNERGRHSGICFVLPRSQGRAWRGAIHSFQMLPLGTWCSKRPSASSRLAAKFC